MSNWKHTQRSLWRIESERPDIPLASATAAPPDEWMVVEGQGLDDKTLAYALAARSVFGQLREAAGQLAALFVLAAAGGRSAQDNPVFALAQSAQAEARDAIRSLHPGKQGAHHHRHLLACSKALAAACDEASKTMHKGQDERTLTLLRQALRQLHFAADALPGFEVVAFGQACCATHGLTKEHDAARERRIRTTKYPQSSTLEG